MSAGTKSTKRKQGKAGNPSPSNDEADKQAETEPSDLNLPPGLPPDFFADVEKRVEEKQKRRAERRKELLERKIESDVRVVAWIDILGFREELLQAEKKGGDELQRVYRKLLRVRQAFDEPSSSIEPLDLEQEQQAYGREVIALSDGLVITASLPRATARGHVTDYDLLMSIISELILAQADCALDGIFVRGGISIGDFFFEDNILLSPALVRAYELESKKAVYPVIVIKAKDIELLRKLDGYKHYAKDAEPSQYELCPFRSPRADDDSSEDLLHLDYLELVANINTYGPTGAQYAELSSGNYTDRERERLFSLYMNRNALNAMIRHKEQIVRAYEAASSEGVRAKYRWLMEYHNRSVEFRLFFYPERAMIDLTGYMPE